ncbi:TPR domain protein [Xylariaceae sp. FL0255]|nr:TPR domain protein [Xylariaceae sp. FL0255]
MEAAEELRIRRMFEQIRTATEKANRQRGYIPTDHPPKDMVVVRFMATLMAKSMARADDRGDMAQLITTQIPLAYPPCVMSMDDLTPMAIKQMRLLESQRGKKVTLRVLTPPDMMNAIMAIVEDEEGTAVLLQLYHQPKPPLIEPEDILHPGMVIVVKEPFFKVGTDGTYSIRVDHVSDVVWLQETDLRIPLQWQPRFVELEDSVTIRRRGNEFVQKEQWAKAERLYSQAIDAAQTEEDKQLAYLNRSLANLRLGSPEKALADALTAMENGGLGEKGSFREARALYELGHFSESLAKWSLFTKSFPHNADARAELEKTEQRVKEQLTGAYNFSSMYNQAKKTPPVIDCATYIGPVAILESPGCGKGLFTTKPVKAGELLLCEKAFAYSYADKDDPAGRKNISLLMQLDNERAIMAFKALHYGDYQAVAVTEVDGQPVVDTFLVDKIISHNSFGAPRTSHGKDLFGDKPAADDNHTTCGIWLTASRFNHACLGNCQRSFIGDMQIVRASQDLPAGAEVHFMYAPCIPRMSYKETQKKLSNWGFVCDCRWCRDRKSTPEKCIMTRNRLLKDLDLALTNLTTTRVVSAALVGRIQKLLRQLRKTYPVGEGAICPELWDGYLTLGGALVSIDPANAIRNTLSGLEVMGYDIIACPPQQSTSNEFRIRRWGYHARSGAIAFAHLCDAYKLVAPDLCPKIKDCARTLYTVCTGNDVDLIK